jgi:predicted metal-dependent peptidase
MSSPFKPCALTSAEQKAWDTTRTALVWHCPAYSHIFYTMLDNTGGKQIALFTECEGLPEEAQFPIAATDGTNVLIRPSTFFKLSLAKRVFVIAHEIQHCIWNHLNLMHSFQKRGKVAYADGTELPYIHKMMNIAQDLVINDLLIEAKIGEFIEGGCHDQSIATAKDSALDAYRKIYEEADAQGRIQHMQGFDAHLAPGSSQGKDPGAAAQGRSESEWNTQIAAAANSARAQGKLPAGLERMFNDLLNPKVDWREHIAALFARKVGSGSFDWRRPDRRLIVRDIYAPGPSGHGAGTIVVGVDTSGSITPKVIDMFFAEMAGILEDLRPKRLLVMWCDAEVHRTDELEDAGDLPGIRCKGAPGGGGTSFIPVFDEIAEMGIEPDALVYLTDGMGSFPQQAPRYTVIWGSIYEDSKYPFGDVVQIPADE